MKLKQSKVFKAGIGYTIGNVMVKGINFLAIPIFSRLLTTEEMGLYTVFAAYEAVLFVFIGMALHSSIRSAKYEFEGKIDDKKRVSSAVHIDGDSTADVVSNDDIEALIASLGQK